MCARHACIPGVVGLVALEGLLGVYLPLLSLLYVQSAIPLWSPLMIGGARAYMYMYMYVYMCMCVFMYMYMYMYTHTHTHTHTHTLAGKVFCEHSRIRRECSECKIKDNMKMAEPLCEHDVDRKICKICRVGALCEHNRERRRCVECGGPGICEHRRIKRQVQCPTVSTLWLCKLMSSVCWACSLVSCTRRQRYIAGECGLRC